MSDNIIRLNQELIHNELKDLVRNSVEGTLNALLDREAEQLVNAEKYEHSGERKGYRSGHYNRNFQTAWQNPSHSLLTYPHDFTYITTFTPVVKLVISVEYSSAVTPQIRQTGNRLSGLAETTYASLLA